jgi:hypothetical protein
MVIWELVVRVEVPTAVITTMFFWVMTPCRLVGRYRRFRETCSESLEMKTACFSETFASTYQYAWRENPEDQNLQILAGPLLVLLKNRFSLSLFKYYISTSEFM